MTLIPAWISNHVSGKVWDEITFPFPNFNGCTVEVWKWISNFIPHRIMDVITYPRLDWTWSQWQSPALIQRCKCSRTLLIGILVSCSSFRKNIRHWGATKILMRCYKKYYCYVVFQKNAVGVLPRYASSYPIHKRDTKVSIISILDCLVNNLFWQATNKIPHYWPFVRGIHWFRKHGMMS